MADLRDLVVVKKDKDESNVLVWVLAIIGVIVVVAGIAYAVYRFVNRDYLEDFEDEFEDEEDIFEDEEDFFEDEGAN